MELSRLRIFHEVATAGSFTRAAERLYISQPAVSQQIQILEGELGTPLFDRIGRRIHLTPAGQVLLPYAARTFALLDEAIDAVREAVGEAGRQLRLGAGDTVATYVLPDLIQQISSRRPEAVLRLVVGNTERLLDAILSNEVEIAIWARQEPHHLLVREPFWTVPLVAVVRPGDPLTRREEVWMRDLAGQRLLLRSKASAIRRYTDDLLVGAGVDTSDAVEMDHLEAIKRTVEVGYGITVAPSFAISREVSLGTLAAVPLADPQAALTLYYVHYADRRLSPAAQTFVDVLAKFSSPDPVLNRAADGSATIQV